MPMLPDPAATVRSRDILVAQVRSPLLEAGSDDAPEAIVFVHGNPGSSRDWRDLIVRTGTFARSIALDMPGFGQADKPASFDYTVTGYARHLGLMLDQLGVERAHLVLHDFGGPWGLAWAAANPDRFASATLINTGVLRGYEWHKMARLWRTPVVGELVQALTTRSRFQQSMQRVNPRGLPEAFVDGMYDDYDRGTRRAVLRLYRATNNPGAATGPLTAALRPLHRPALVVWGEQDPFIPVEQAERQREVFPDARIVILPESGHWPYADDPEAVAAAVIPFLQSVVGAPADNANQHAGQA